MLFWIHNVPHIHKHSGFKFIALDSLSQTCYLELFKLVLFFIYLVRETTVVVDASDQLQFVLRLCVCLVL